MSDLSGKTAVVTGSTSGIGLGIAKALIARGANVALNSFSDSEADHAVAAEVAQLATGGAKAIYVQADMSDPDACVALVQKAEAAFGAVDILVNNAGVQFVSPVENFPVAKWNQIIAINLSSAFHTSRAAIPGMKRRKWGRIVNIASAQGLTASPYHSAYVAAKHGVVGLTKTIALEFADEKIKATCNAICPGYVWTPLVAGQLEDQMKAHGMTKEEVLEKIMLARQPSREFATVEQLGGTTAFLCSEDAAQITGTTISVDGGWTAL